MGEVVKEKGGFDLIKLLEKMADLRVDRLKYQEYTQGDYFKQYPEREEMFEDMWKNNVHSFINMSPEILNIVYSLKSKAEKENTNSDIIVQEDMAYILNMNGNIESPKPEETIQIKDEIYTVIKLIMASRCCAGMRTEGYILNGSNDIEELILNSDPEILKKTYIVAKKIDVQSFPKRDLANSIQMAIFRAYKLDKAKLEEVLPETFINKNLEDYSDLGFEL